MKVEFKDQEKTYLAEAQLIKGQLWVHFKGKTFLYESEQQKKRKKKTKGGGDGIILAPMPGKITKMFRSKDVEVKPGDAILVMEAMKMEYTLKADIAGKLIAIDCTVGEQVALGKQLAQIQAEKKL